MSAPLPPVLRRMASAVAVCALLAGVAGCSRANVAEADTASVSTGASDEMGGGTPIAGREARAYIAGHANAVPLPPGATFDRIDVTDLQTPAGLDGTMRFYAFCRWAEATQPGPDGRAGAGAAAAPSRLAHLAAERSAATAGVVDLLRGVADAATKGNAPVVDAFVRANCG